MQVLHSTNQLTPSPGPRPSALLFVKLDLDADISSGKLLEIKSAIVRATLLIICAAGFGKRASWSEFSGPQQQSSTREKIMPFHIAVSLTLEKLFVKVLTPNIAYSLRFKVPLLLKQLEEARGAFANLKVHIEDLVSEARIALTCLKN